MTQQLWAPWRLEYIESAKTRPGCIFCDFPAADVTRDPENLVLHRGTTAFLLLNRFPYANGHLMVAAYRHTKSLDDLTAEELLEAMELIRAGVRLLTNAMHPEGFNIGMNMGRTAGAGIADHLHWHIVPRWDGDNNFMPVIADIRVIPESLDKMHARLRSGLASAGLVRSGARADQK